MIILILLSYRIVQYFIVVSCLFLLTIVNNSKRKHTKLWLGICVCMYERTRFKLYRRMDLYVCCIYTKALTPISIHMCVHATRRNIEFITINILVRWNAVQGRSMWLIYYTTHRSTLPFSASFKWPFFVVSLEIN